MKFHRIIPLDILRVGQSVSLSSKHTRVEVENKTKQNKTKQQQQQKTFSFISFSEIANKSTNLQDKHQRLIQQRRLPHHDHLLQVCV